MPVCDRSPGAQILFVKPQIDRLGAKVRSLAELVVSLIDLIEEARAVEPLIQALKDKSSFVRRNAAEALGDIGDKRAVEPLTEAVIFEATLNKYYYVQASEETALKKIKAKKS